MTCTTAVIQRRSNLMSELGWKSDAMIKSMICIHAPTEGKTIWPKVISKSVKNKHNHNKVYDNLDGKKLQ